MARTGDRISPEFINLSFVRDGDKGRCFWSVASTGNYALDNALGAGLALELLADLRKHRRTYVLGWIVAAMVKKDDFGGVEIGFFYALSQALLAQGTLP